MPSTSTCCTCGHQWSNGTDGEHSCAAVLLTEVKELRKSVRKLKAAEGLNQAKIVRMRARLRHYQSLLEKRR